MDRPFLYDEAVLEACNRNEEEVCDELYRSHANHFGFDEDTASMAFFLEAVQKIARHSELSLYSTGLNRFARPEGYPHSEHRRLSNSTDVVELLGIGKGSMHVLHHPKHKSLNPDHVVRIPGNQNPLPFEPSLDSDLTNSLVVLRANHLVPDYTGSATHLNWATRDNPDGVPLVHPAIDQGTCGSCWALAATGSLEASVARSVGAAVYQASTMQEAQLAAQNAFHSLNLSIQELLDCDTMTDQGCTGGNPLLAYYYISKHGLTTWAEYPYVGEQQATCARVDTPGMATASSWGLVEANHENHMELALRYIGPLAVGINADTLLSYRGGIFDDTTCPQTANHALLVTGYGEEVIGNKVVRYWIARNSWGRGWGEDGYVRIKRGKGGKGRPGICGIARSPSAALGGIYLKDRNVFEDRWHRVCESMQHGNHTDHWCSPTVDWMEGHQALVYSSVAFLVLLCALVPLTSDCRRRRRLRRQREARRRKEMERNGLVEDDLWETLEETEPLTANGERNYASFASPESAVVP